MLKRRNAKYRNANSKIIKKKGLSFWGLKLFFYDGRFSYSFSLALFLLLFLLLFFAFLLLR